MAKPGEPYYRADLALVHHLGFGFHADDCAPGVLELLAPVRERDGLVVELGCGSGLLTRYLVDAGHRVIATDASPAMLDLAPRTPPGRRRSASSCCRTTRSRRRTRSSRSGTC
jgi:trans-aconitate methyltransferase